MLRTTSIYVLSEPRTERPRYVGVTGDVHLRMIAYRSAAKALLKSGPLRGEPSDVEHWIASLMLEKAEPAVSVVMTIKCDRFLDRCRCRSYCRGAFEAEERHIAALEEAGYELLNIDRSRRVD